MRGEGWGMGVGWAQEWVGRQNQEKNSWGTSTKKMDKNHGLIDGPRFHQFNEHNSQFNHSQQ